MAHNVAFHFFAKPDYVRAKFDIVGADENVIYVLCIPQIEVMCRENVNYVSFIWPGILHFLIVLNYRLVMNIMFGSDILCGWGF